VGGSRNAPRVHVGFAGQRPGVAAGVDESCVRSPTASSTSVARRRWWFRRSASSRSSIDNQRLASLRRHAVAGHIRLAMRPRLRLFAGSFGAASVASGGGSGVRVPASALLFSGLRATAVLGQRSGRFRGNASPRAPGTLRAGSSGSGLGCSRSFNASVAPASSALELRVRDTRLTG
jgi:hypothetical protein